MRFALQYFEGSITPATLAATGMFSFTASAILIVFGGDVLAYEAGEGNPFITEFWDASPFDTESGEGSPLILQPSIV